MREDMFEVIIERPRYDSGWRRPRPRPRDLEAAPLREPVGRGGTKFLNENLAPLIRFLGRRVGQPWDVVHSEISAHLSLGSAVQKHVLDHVRELVELNPVIVDGWPFHPAARNGKLEPIVSRYRGVFYVCPSTGRLCAAPRPSRARRVAQRDRVVLDGAREAWQIALIWYEVRFAPLPAQLAGARDVVLRRGLDENGVVGWNGELAREYGRHDRYAVGKRQLSRREIAMVERLLKQKR
jgi:hypothetical protein